MNAPAVPPAGDEASPPASEPGGPTAPPSSTAVAPHDALDAPGPRRPDLRFLRAHPAHWLALGFGSGLPRFAPGTWGTLAAWAIFALLDPWFTDLVWLGVILLGLYVGAWAAQRTGRALGRADSGHIVIDEMVAFWIVLVMLPDAVELKGLQHTIAFALFRFFDIVKPPPIRFFDARIDNGIGVMFDDLLAAFYTLLLFALWYRLA